MKLLFRYLLISVFLLWWEPNSSLGAAQNLVITFLDCGQGEAVVIQTPHGKNILIDAGPIERDDEGNETFDAGREVLIPFLKAHHIERIDVAVLSHAHVDHIGGFRALLQEFPVDQFIGPGFDYESYDYENFLKTLKKKKIPHEVRHAGDRLEWDPDLKVRVLAPTQPFQWGNPNDNSLVIRLQHGRVSFLFTGDIQRESEYHLVIHQERSLRSQILKVAHHGSRTSSTPEFLQAVHPKFAIISVGRQNKHNMPHKNVLTRFQNLNIKLYRTDKNGNIRVTSNGKKFKVTFP